MEIARSRAFKNLRSRPSGFRTVVRKATLSACRLQRQVHTDSGDGPTPHEPLPTDESQPRPPIQYVHSHTVLINSLLDY